jgi:hypothetical protein
MFLSLVNLHVNIVGTMTGAYEKHSTQSHWCLSSGILPSEKKMGQLFLNEFGESTPNPAVSLVCCAV